MANIALARKALEHAEKYPEQHDQSTWCRVAYGRTIEEFPVAADNGDHPPCGTTLCMAGWVTFLAAPKGTKLYGGSSTFVLPDSDDPTSMWDFAEKALELNRSQTEALFIQAYDLDTVKAMVGVLEANPAASYDYLMDAAGLDYTPVDEVDD